MEDEDLRIEVYAQGVWPARSVKVVATYLPTDDTARSDVHRSEHVARAEAVHRLLALLEAKAS